jgi:erythromycin esterase-like protein
MPLSWNEIKSRASAFVLEWKDSQTVREKAEAQTFETEFLNIFGVDRKKVALFEHEVHFGDGQNSLFEDLSGDCMIEAHLCDGDIAVFHPGITTGNGIFVVSIGNSLVVKRVDRDSASQTIVLYSANPAYEPRHFSGDELNDIRIPGRVVACYHKV